MNDLQTRRARSSRDSPDGVKTGGHAVMTNLNDIKLIARRWLERARPSTMARTRIALIVHDGRKRALLEWARDNCSTQGVGSLFPTRSRRGGGKDARP